MSLPFRNVAKPIKLTVSKKKKQKNTGQLKNREQGIKITHTVAGPFLTCTESTHWAIDEVDGTGDAVHSCTCCAPCKGTLAR